MSCSKEYGMTIRKKYTISISVMVVATILVCFKVIDSSDWVKVILGTMATITAGFIGKKYAEKD